MGDLMMERARERGKVAILFSHCAFLLCLCSTPLVFWIYPLTFKYPAFVSR